MMKGLPLQSPGDFDSKAPNMPGSKLFLGGSEEARFSFALPISLSISPYFSIFQIKSIGKIHHK
jgi:hypothetical protein